MMSFGHFHSIELFQKGHLYSPKENAELSYQGRHLPDFRNVNAVCRINKKLWKLVSDLISPFLQSKDAFSLVLFKCALFHQPLQAGAQFGCWLKTKSFGRLFHIVF